MANIWKVTSKRGGVNGGLSLVGERGEKTWDRHYGRRNQEYSSGAKQLYRRTMASWKVLNNMRK